MFLTKEVWGSWPPTRWFLCLGSGLGHCFELGFARKKRATLGKLLLPMQCEGPSSSELYSYPL